MLRLASITLSGLSTAWLLYWLPRSEWKYRPRSGFRTIRAFLSAVTTNSASKVSQEFPSYHRSAEEIQDHSQVQPSFHRRNISNIADPDLVDSTGLQILYQIGYSAISRHCRARSEGLLATRRQFIFTHQPRYSILSAVDPILAKRLAHPGTAVTPFIGCKDSPYLLHQFGLLSIPQTRFATSKLARYLHHTLAAVDHQLHRLAFVLFRIHRVLSLFCFHRVLFLSLSSRVRQIGGGSG